MTTPELKEAALKVQAELKGQILRIQTDLKSTQLGSRQKGVLQTLLDQLSEALEELSEALEERSTTPNR